jgi:hypothetical protein
MRVLRKATDLGAERTLALAATIADEFGRAGWTLSDYSWLVWSSEEDSVIELAFESTSPDAVAPGEREGSGLTLQHPGQAAFLLTVVVPLVLIAALVLVVLLLARH